VKIKIIQKILNKKSIPKCQDNFEFSSHMSWIVVILILKNEENIKGLFWKVILQFPNKIMI
jgi:hypothetical protein